MADMGAYLVNLKDYMGITGADGDIVLLRLLSAAWATAQKATGQLWNSALTAQTETWIGEGGSVYFPTKQPISAITSLTIDDTTIPASTGFGVAGYYLDGYSVRLRGYEFGEGSECALVLSYGQAAPPDDLSQAVIELAAIKSAAPSHLGQKSTTGMSKETVSYFDSDITPTIQAVFDRYTLRFL